MWKLLPWFSCHASLTLLILVLQTALAELLDNPPEDQLFRRGLSRALDFFLGGMANTWTDPDWNDNMKPIAAMVSYDMKTKTLSKSSFQMAIPPTGTLRDARAEYVPQFGPNGLISVLGGVTFNAELAPDHMLDLTNITFFDPRTGQWLWQKTSGNAPRNRQSFCMVGVTGQAGTYELFIHGGNDAGNQMSYDDFYILSLPGFHWFEVTDLSPEPRAETSCAVIGNRQMLIVGGHNFAQGSSQGWKVKDTFPQGLGLFDMVDLTFVKDFSYNAHAEAYRTSKVVEDWYRTNTNLSDSVPWSSKEVKDMFLAKPVVFDDSNLATTTPSSTASPPNTTTPGSNVGQIAGAVVGALVGAAILLSLVYYFWSRKPSPSSLVELGSLEGTLSSNTKTELSAEPLVTEMPVSCPPGLKTSHEETTHELNAQSDIYELDVTSCACELDVPTSRTCASDVAKQTGDLEDQKRHSNMAPSRES
ncbi:unnamed protein product [Sordaria macrospora k-hell]|uniref:WGS project CABT00000000 data, contig 2.10 n=2 Tax=Sordaria macrospora TaxID=5147 RepID=F7VW00_SORMK|nr:uncharacterized protein SMAC_03378 [Sordaria macrospora k-hell]KAH7629976.1 hypothetical protein B0T09DRAFT_357613 [Sordaria sp. MPI-SDFR-AT-0083]CCC09822.1 unnamed protein product [Sordaria macrospora k-hell]